MSLFAKDSSLIIKEAEEFMIQNTPVNSTGPGSKFYALLQILKKHLEEAYTTFDFNIAIGLIYGARGRYLDYLGDIFGVQRTRPYTATVDKDHSIVKFYTTKANFGAIQSGMTVTRGTKIWALRNEERVEFVVTENLSLPDGDTEAYASVKAVELGANSNTQPNTIIYHNFAQTEVLVTNINSVDSGSDAETDENYRYRIINQKLVGATSNETALRLACLQIPGIADIGYFDKHYGAATTAIIVKSTTPTVTAATLARAQLEVDKVKGSGMNVLVIAPTYLSMRFVIDVRYLENASTQEKSVARENITIAITDYVNNLDIGQDFNANKLASIVVASHPKIKSIGKANKYFDKIYVKRSVIEVETLGDYIPSETQKLIMSTETNNIVFV